jgi:hypothetical protein
VNRKLQVFIYYLALMFLIYCTHAIAVGIIQLMCSPPDWLYELSFFIIAGIYTFIICKYQVHVKIKMHTKVIFDYKNRKHL